MSCYNKQDSSFVCSSFSLALEFKVETVDMIDIEKFVLPRSVERNPLIRIHLMALKVFGYVLFDDQRHKRLHCFRGVVFSVSFVLFNATQVSINFLI
jgi:hypothetical protein